MKKGEMFEGIIESVEFPNKGIVWVQGENDEEPVRVIVKNGMPGQKIRFQINKKRKNKCEGRLLEVLEKSAYETCDPVCGQFPACGGCMYQTMAYEEQMKRLVEFVEKSSKEFFKGMERIDKEIDEFIIKGEYDKADSLLLSKGYFNKRIENIEKLEQVTEQLVKDAVSDCRKYYEINRDKIKYDEALAYLDTARVLQEKHFGLQDLDLAITYNNIGGVYLDQGKNEEAMEWHKKALAIFEKVSDPLSPALATIYNNIGNVYLAQGKNEEALKWLEKALAIQEKVLDQLSYDLTNTYGNIGQVYFQIKKYEEALEYFNKALPGRIKRYGEEHDRTKIVKERIEECKQALGE